VEEMINHRGHEEHEEELKLFGIKKDTCSGFPFFVSFVLFVVKRFCFGEAMSFAV
jgi:hypothetical protein